MSYGASGYPTLPQQRERLGHDQDHEDTLRDSCGVSRRRTRPEPEDTSQWSQTRRGRHSSARASPEGTWLGQRGTRSDTPWRKTRHDSHEARARVTGKPSEKCGRDISASLPPPGLRQKSGDEIKRGIPARPPLAGPGQTPHEKPGRNISASPPPPGLRQKPRETRKRYLCQPSSGRAGAKVGRETPRRYTCQSSSGQA